MEQLLETGKQLETALQATALIDVFRMGPAIYVACFQEKLKGATYFLRHLCVMPILRLQEFKHRMTQLK